MVEKMLLIDFFNDPNSAIIFGCVLGVLLFLIGVTNLIRTKNDFYDDVHQHGNRVIFLLMVCCNLGRKDST